jgi:hypothetical protein
MNPEYKELPAFDHLAPMIVFHIDFDFLEPRISALRNDSRWDRD